MFPKQRQRVLLLGDSFTFGLNTHDVDTWATFLAERLPRHEIVNAGVPGYTIVQEAALFAERAKYVEPEVVVLQVLFNDLYGFFFFERFFFARERWQESTIWRRRSLRRGNDTAPSDLEREFLLSLGVEM